MRPGDTRESRPGTALNPEMIGIGDSFGQRAERPGSLQARRGPKMPKACAIWSKPHAGRVWRSDAFRTGPAAAGGGMIFGSWA